MFWKMSERITCFLLPEAGEEDREIYCYGLWVLLTTMFDIMEILFLGIILHRVVESVIYLAILMVLRTYTGGFHASTFIRCNLMSVGCYLLNLVISRGVVRAGGSCGVWLLLAILVGFICCAAPVEHANKPLTKDEKIRYRRYSIMLSVGVLVSVLLLYHKYEQQMAYVTVTMAMVAVMMLLELLLQGRRRRLQ